VHWRDAWYQEFGGTTGFDKTWHDYWINLPANPTIELYARANISAFTSFFARSFSQQQKFATFDEFVKAAQQNQLKSHAADWLPPSVLAEALRAHAALVRNKYVFALQGQSPPALVCTLPDGRRVVGRFTIRNGGRVATVRTEVLGKPR
jgi:hypothetical protein